MLVYDMCTPYKSCMMFGKAPGLIQDFPLWWGDYGGGRHPSVEYQAKLLVRLYLLQMIFEQ